MTSQEIIIYKKIDDILWFDWDPIGINNAEEARDEYQSYLYHVYDLKMTGGGSDKIAKHLFNIETVNMGLAGDMSRCLKVADKILSI